MAEVGGELAGPGRAAAEPLQRLHIPAILRTYFSKPEMLLHHRLTIQLSAPPAS